MIEYSSLMLEILDMPKRELFFGFLWSTTMVCVRVASTWVKDLTSVIVEIEKLIDSNGRIRKSRNGKDSLMKGGGDHRVTPLRSRAKLR